MEALPGNQQSLISFLKSRNLSVLLADDNRVNQFLGKRILQNIGITKVDLASDGPEAFEMLRTNVYDVLLTDVEMPGMTGYELARAVRSTLPEDSLPVIIALTANASDDDREQAKSAGIDDYLTKPYSPQDLMDVLLQHFGKEDFMVLEEVQISPSKTHSSLHKIYEVFHSNREDARHFLMMLSQQLPTLINEIKAGIAADEWDRAFQAAHKLKSPVTLIGNTELSFALGKLADDLRHRKELANTPAALENLLPQLESLLVLINTELENG